MHPMLYIQFLGYAGVNPGTGCMVSLMTRPKSVQDREPLVLNYPSKPMAYWQIQNHAWHQKSLGENTHRTHSRYAPAKLKCLKLLVHALDTKIRKLHPLSPMVKTWEEKLASAPPFTTSTDLVFEGDHIPSDCSNQRLEHISSQPRDWCRFHHWQISGCQYIII